MDYRELMSFAPKDCQPTVITKESRLQDWAKHLGKKVEDLTEEEIAAEAENYEKTCMTDYDMLTS